jgi:hypothetical protein
MKPKWLKKLHKDKPWKYPIKFERVGMIEVYNFTTPIGFDCGEIDKAIEWIDKYGKER